MHRILKIFLLIQTCILVISCEHNNGSSQASFESLVIEYNFEEAKYELVAKKIYSLDIPRNLDSNVAKFFYKMDSNVDLEYESPVQLNLIKTSEDLYVAKDLSSLKSISSYKIYEDFYDLHKKLGILNYSVWPKKVVIDGVDGSETNNAFHFPSQTSTFYLPFDPEDVPASLNPGIIAHEETHGLFFNQAVKGNLSENLFIANSELLSINHKTAKKCLRAMTCGTLKSLYEVTDEFNGVVNSSIFASKLDNMEYNHTILKALDEGLADYSGYIFTKVPNFLTVTLGYESERGQFNRVIGNSLSEPLPSVDQLQAIIDQIKGEENINFNSLSVAYKNLSKSTPVLLTLSYRMAGQISSLLNVLSKNINYSNKPVHLTKNEYFYKLIAESLGNLKPVIFEKYQSNALKISFNDFFQAILDEGLITSETCKVLKDNLSDKITIKGCSI